MLRECAQRLVETADFIRNFGNHSAITTVTTATSTTPTSTAAMPQPQPNNAPTDGRVHDTNRNEHNRLFSYRPPAPTRVLQLRGSRTSRSRRHLYTNSAAGRANATWSRSFVCLAVAGQQTPPSTSERDKKKVDRPARLSRTCISHSHSLDLTSISLGSHPFCMIFPGVLPENLGGGVRRTL